MTNSVDDEIISYLSHFDDLLIDGQTDECNSIIKLIDVNNQHVDVLLAILMVTSSVPRGVLKSRESFYAATRNRFIAEVGENETAEILDRLR